MSQALRQDIKPSAMTLLIFLCGATNDISLHVIGQYYVSEFLILIVAVFGLFLWRTYEALDTRILLSFMLAGLITLLGYVLSDIHVGTQPSQYLRGWGRTIIMITNCFAIMLLAMKDRQNLWWFILGSGTGGVIYLYLTGVPIESWKLGYGERVAMIFLTLLILAPRKSWGIALLGYGLLNIALDYRSLGAGLTLAAAILIASSVRPDKRFMALVVAGSVMLFSIVAAISLTQDEYIAHRMDSNIGRTSGIIVSLRAIAQSPLVGYGSWTVNKEFAAELRKEIRSRRAEAGGQVDFSRLRTGSGFQSHSQIIQSWVEGGVLGAVFFLYYGYRLLQAGAWCALKRRLDVFSPIFAFTLIMGVWNLFMSPFLGFSRMQIALAVGVIVMMMIERKGNVVPVPSDTVAGRGADRQPRILRRAK